MSWEAYEQGYFDGLCEAHADVLVKWDLQGRERRRPAADPHPAYYEGFHTWLKDGGEVLLAISKTIRPR
jgi:hypothetical protein